MVILYHMPLETFNDAPGHMTTESEATALLKRDKFGKEAVAVTAASFPPGAVIARKIEKEESGARLKMR